MASRTASHREVCSFTTVTGRVSSSLVALPIADAAAK